MSPFRERLEAAAKRLEELGQRSSPMVRAAIKRDLVAVRAASSMLEGEPCERCNGRGDEKCIDCGGTGDL